jgi:chaperonin GroEL (HSP60 family)
VPEQDLLNIARTTLSSKILTHDKDHFARLAVDAVMRLRGSTNLESIHIIKKPGGTLKVRMGGACYDEGACRTGSGRDQHTEGALASKRCSA